MNRIMVIGSGGAGKSTLARGGGLALGIEVIHLDALFWHPGWVGTPRAEWEALQRTLVQRPRWVMDGNYGGTMEIRLAAADTVVFLDLPRRDCLWGVLRRRVRYAGRSRPDLADGCPERLTWEFLRWIWQFPSRRPALLERLDRYREGRRILHLRSPGDVRRLLASIDER
jgi:adenylate kinase family enzyme